jgi:hypothetical protein
MNVGIVIVQEYLLQVSNARLDEQRVGQFENSTVDDFASRAVVRTTAVIV